ncbi:MAG: TetR/AcrR family transcriptional regulator [Candidatus Dormibacteria bacterium]
MGRVPLAERAPYDRDHIVDVAVRVFHERGFDGTSMADIAAALGIHKSSLYHHISGKEALLDEAVKRALNALHGMLAEPEAVEGRAVHRLRYVVRRTVEIMVRQLPEVTLLLRVRGNTPTERWALSRRRDFDRAVQALLAQAIADGDLRADIEASLATRLVFGMSNSVTEWYSAGGRLAAGDLANAISDIVFTGLDATPTRTAH